MLEAFFAYGTVFISFFVVRERHRESQRIAKEQDQLEDEIENRDEDIRRRSDEEVELKLLSSQFSPQIIERIKSNNLSLDQGTHVKNISYIFVDIVGSTARTNALDLDDLRTATNMFMDDAIKTFLFYDLTIDKFKGDAVSAFANDPVEMENYVERTCLAAVALRNKITGKKAEYEKHWKSDFAITIGIACGPCEIGFYGHNDYFKTYSAKGEAPLLAEELTNFAQPNQIVIDSDVLDSCTQSRPITRFYKKAKVEAFKDFETHAYELVGMDESKITEIENNHCPSCDEPELYLIFEQGIGLLQCRACHQVVMDMDDLKPKKTA